jgi:hypothetical protein
MSDTRRWRIVAVTEAFEATDLTDGELIGISVLLTHRAGEPHTDRNVYWRARQKIQPQVEQALDDR